MNLDVSMLTGLGLSWSVKIISAGLVLKDSLAHFASGVLLILFRPFRVDDFVRLAGISIPYPQQDVHLHQPGGQG